MIAGASIAFYALIGFEDAVNVAEETQDATKSFPRTLFTGLGIAGAIYLLVTIIAGMTVPASTLAESDGPLLEVVTQGPLAVNSKVFAAIALFALINGCLLNLMMAAAADVRHGAREGRPRACSARSTRAAARRGWRSPSPRASPPCWSSSATSRRSPTRPSCCCCWCSSGSTSRCSSCAASPWTTTTSRRRRCSRTSASITCAGLAIQSVVDDPKLVLWAGGLIVFGLILWVIERAVR